MTVPPNPVQPDGVGNGSSDGPLKDPDRGQWKREWRDLLDILNIIARDAVGALCVLAIYTATDWTAEQIDSIRHLEWNSGTGFAFTAHDLFRASAFIVVATFAARSVWKVIRRIMK